MIEEFSRRSCMRWWYMCVYKVWVSVRTLASYYTETDIDCAFCSLHIN